MVIKILHFLRPPLFQRGYNQLNDELEIEQQPSRGICNTTKRARTVAGLVFLVGGISVCVNILFMNTRRIWFYILNQYIVPAGLVIISLLQKSTCVSTRVHVVRFKIALFFMFISALAILVLLVIIPLLPHHDKNNDPYHGIGNEEENKAARQDNNATQFMYDSLYDAIHRSSKAKPTHTNFSLIYFHSSRKFGMHTHTHYICNTAPTILQTIDLANITAGKHTKQQHQRH